MGSHRYFYLGPYLICKAKLIDASRDMRTCPNASCSNHTKEYANGLSFKNDGLEFCLKCGTKVDNVPVPYKKISVNHWDMSEKIKEAFHAGWPLFATRPRISPCPPSSGAATRGSTARPLDLQVQPV